VHNDCIAIRLRLPGLVVVESKERADRIEVVAGYCDQEAVCPRCGRSTWQVHQRRQQRKRDARLWGKPVWILLWKRRFRCRRCHKVFMEPDPACGRFRRTTRRLRRQVAKEAEEAPVRAVARWQGVSEGLVQRSWVEAHPPPARDGPPVFLGLDAFCVARPREMWTGFWDLQRRAPLAAVPGEGQRQVQPVLDSLPRPEMVQAVAMDLHEPYRQAVQMVLPEAAIVADKFHVVALANKALREVRRGRRQRGNLAWFLDRGVEGLRPQERAHLLEELAAWPELACAWGLKEGLRSLYHSQTRAEVAQGLNAWLRAAWNSGLPSFRRLAGTVERWREEILNYWRFPLTNALVEGKHNRVKTMKRRAYGYRNRRVFLLRFLNLVHTD
jgi:transposase